MIKSIIVAGAIAAGVVAAGAGSAYAEEVEVEGSYGTMAACQADGPSVEVQGDSASWTGYDCRQGGDGLYHLFLSK